MDERQTRVDIVIVGWNKFELTRACLESIRENTPPDRYRIIYVDNGSRFPGFDALIADYPDVVSVRLNENTGFPHGANVGLALSLVNDGDYVVLMNNDVEIPEGHDSWLERWSARMTHPKIGAVGAVSDRVFGFQRREREIPGTFAQQVPALIFFAVMLRKDAVRKVGLLDERFTPGNYEDFDYSVRLTRANWTMAVAEDVWLHHRMHASHEGLDLKSILETNQRKFIDKWGADVARSVGVG